MRTEPLKVAFLSDEAHWLVSFQVRMAGAMGGKYLPRESLQKYRHWFKTVVTPLRGGKTPNLAGRLTIWRLDRSKIDEGR